MKITKKEPPVIIIYLDENRKHKQVIKPTEYFDGDVARYIRDVFNSSIRQMDGTVIHYRNYHSYEVIKP